MAGRCDHALNPPCEWSPRERIMQQTHETALATICSGYDVRLWVGPLHLASLALSCLWAPTPWVPLLLTALTSVLIYARLSKLAVAIELVILLARLVNAVPPPPLAWSICLLRLPAGSPAFSVSTSLAAFRGHLSDECSTDWHALHQPSVAKAALVKHCV